MEDRGQNVPWHRHVLPIGVPGKEVIAQFGRLHYLLHALQDQPLSTC